MEFDLTTINRSRLESLPLAVLPPTYLLQAGCGNGCYLDPPGFPSYFTRDVYTQHGNAPGNPGSVSMTILGRAVARVRDDHEKTAARLRRLWSPLPLEHARTVAWIRDTYRHFARCYFAPDRSVEPGASPIVLESEAAGLGIAMPENHAAAVRIRRFYPDHAPDLEYIAHPPSTVDGDWWTVYAACPSPGECPGMVDRWGRGGGYTVTHPINGSWCQVCGWHEEEGKRTA
jgi:hypothetical protein